MMSRICPTMIFLLLQVLQLRIVGAECPPKDFTTVSDFDSKAFVASRWWIQQQMPTKFLPATQNRCVYAEYKVLEKKSFWGYDIDVHNFAEDLAPPHAAHDSGSYICAKFYDEAHGKLGVAPCFLPAALSGDYWILAFDDAKGYALISGGAPTNTFPGGCRTGTGTNGSGLWIFTREQKRDEALITEARSIATAKGFDLSVLNDVDQTACGPQEARPMPLVV